MKTKIKRTTPEYRREVLGQVTANLKNGISVKESCHRLGIHTANYYYWRQMENQREQKVLRDSGSEVIVATPDSVDVLVAENTKLKKLLSKLLLEQALQNV